MINKILRLDFVLSKWFAGKRKTENVVPGLAYLFLSKVIYLGEVFVFLFLKLVGVKEPIFMAFGIMIYSLLVILIGRSPIEQTVRNPVFEKYYKSLSKSQVYVKRAIALFTLIASFFFMIIGSIMIARIKF
ncbi:hypothetical protein [Sphingobacterium siyangense]|uniref:hypothetical protein n=1 Tax=Sphingobacterium siyangense TaxID=459529 RepID=UPI00196446D0|nr:hypothetical protein [Sphingobacterium siyangense]QRY57162.1 hypothetical protein JVX97_24740 [Sphingobacterium siyangense]